VDATPAVGRILIAAEEWGIDYLVLSAHKLYGPKGADALVGPPARTPFADTIFGHAGTLNVPCIVGFGEACRLRAAEGSTEEARAVELRDRLEATLIGQIPDLVINGDRSNRLGNNLHISVLGAPNDAVISRLHHSVAISMGAACSSGVRNIARLARHGIVARIAGNRSAHLDRKIQHRGRNRFCRIRNRNGRRGRSRRNGGALMRTAEIGAKPPWRIALFRARNLRVPLRMAAEGLSRLAGQSPSVLGRRRRDGRAWSRQKHDSLASVLGREHGPRRARLAPQLSADRFRSRDLRSGFDPYLEDIRTLWLIHWNLASRADGALFAWRYLLNQWPYPEFARSEALAAFARESKRLGYSHSTITLTQHLESFLHTYYPARSKTRAVEDSLNGPLVELALLQTVGEKKGDSGRWETVYAFRREPKPEITAELFEYCLADFWARLQPNEETLTLREITLGICSPGQVFKLAEDDLRARLETYAGSRSGRPFVYQPSAIQALLSKRRRTPAPTLEEIYRRELANA
jgi:uncharacterized protein DUF4007/aminotransferase class V